MKKKVIDRNHKKYEEAINRITTLFPGFPTSISISDWFNIEKSSQVQRECEKMIILLHYKEAELGWCLYDYGVKNQRISEIIKMIRKEITKIDIVSDSNIYCLDSYVNNLIENEDIENMINDFELSQGDKKKIERAFYFFKEGDFYTASLYLTALIDMQNIKMEMQQHNRFKDGDKTVQCWKSYIRIVDYCFPDILVNGKIRNNDITNGNTRREKFEELVDNINYEKYPSYSTKVPMVFGIGYSLLNFFDNTDWDEYETVRPAYFNRNWLMHGMYDLNDIERIDCIKLFFLLYSINLLFSEIRMKQMMEVE